MPSVHPFELAGLGKAPFRVVGFSVRKYQACQGAPVQPGASCDYCGTGIMNVFEILSSDARKFVVGCDCVAKTGDVKLIAEVKASQAERRAAAKQARNVARAEARKSTAAERFAALPADLHEAFADCTHPIVVDIARRAREHGDVSASQAELVRKLYGEFIGRRDAVGCALPPPVTAPVTVQRLAIEGTILATKLHESIYGDVLKMLVAVRTPDGQWKCWGTVPQFVFDQRREEGRDDLKGMRVAFSARFEASKDDPTFAFFSRPTCPKAKVARTGGRVIDRETSLAELATTLKTVKAADCVVISFPDADAISVPANKIRQALAALKGRHFDGLVVEAWPGKRQLVFVWATGALCLKHQTGSTSIVKRGHVSRSVTKPFTRPAYLRLERERERPHEAVATG